MAHVEIWDRKKRLKKGRKKGAHFIPCSFLTGKRGVRFVHLAPRRRNKRSTIRLSFWKKGGRKIALVQSGKEKEGGGGRKKKER